MTTNIASECAEYEVEGGTATMSAGKPDCHNCVHFDDGYCKIYQREKIASADYARDPE